MKFISYVFFVILILIALALGSENSQPVSVNLLFVQLQMSLAAVIYGAFLIGLISALFIFILKKIKPNA